jgi:hypothetical protein
MRDLAQPGMLNAILLLKVHGSEQTHNKVFAGLF